MLASFFLYYLLQLFFSKTWAQQCLQTNKDTGLCYSCGADFFPDPEIYKEVDWATNLPHSHCIKKAISTSPSSYFVLGSQAIDTGPNTFTTFIEALNRLSKDARMWSNFTASIFLNNQNHFITSDQLPGISNSTEFLRRTEVSLSIEPLLCSYRALPGCFQDESASFANLTIKTDKFRLFISREITVKRLRLFGNDLHLAEDDACKLKLELCCKSELLKKTLSDDPACGISERKMDALWKGAPGSSKLGLLNTEFLWDSPSLYIPRISVIKCFFINFYGFKQDTYPSLIKYEKRFPFTVSLIDATFEDFLLENGPILGNDELKDPFYSFLAAEDFARISPNALVKKNEVLLQNIRLLNYNQFGAGFNQSFYLFFSSTENPLLSFKTLEMDRISIPKALLFKFSSSNVLFENLTLTNSEISKAFSFSNSAVNITVLRGLSIILNSLFWDIDSSTLNASDLEFFQINFAYKASEIAILMRASLNSTIILKTAIFHFSQGASFNFANSKVKLSFVRIINSIFRENLFDLILSETTITNMTLYNISYVPPLQSSKTLFNAQKGFLDLDAVNVSSVNALGLFLILDANHSIWNSSFSNFYNLLWFYQICNIFHMKWINSHFSGGGVKAFINNERYDLTNFSLVLIDNCRFSHIFTKGEFKFRFYTAHVFCWNSVFVNLTLSIDSRVFLKIKEGDLFIENSTFVNCGFLGETTALVKIFDTSLFQNWMSYINEIRNATFLIDDCCSMRGGFVNVFNSYAPFIMLDSTFKVTKQNPKYNYKGVVVLNAPTNLVRNSSFFNLQCNRPETIEQENGAGLLILGTLSYIPADTGIKAQLESLSFDNCTCGSGGALSVLNLQDVELKNSRFAVSAATDSGGHLSSLYTNNISLRENSFSISRSGWQGGAIHIYLARFFSIDNSSIRGSQSRTAGAIYLESVAKAVLNNVLISNSTANSDCGGLFLERSMLTGTNLSFEKIRSEAGQGGVLFISGYSNLTLGNFKSDESFSNQGGFLNVKSNFFLTLFNGSIKASKSSSKAAALLITKSSNFELRDIKFEACESKNDDGIVYINGYEKVTFKLLNITCYKNVAKNGNCIYSNSDANIKIENLVAEHGLGSVLTFFSFGNPIIELLNIRISNNNRIEEYIAGDLVRVTSVNLKMNNSVIEANNAVEYGFYISKANIILARCFFINTHSLRASMYNLYAISSHLLITGSSFTSSSEFNSGVVYSENSKVTIIETSIYNCSTRGLANLQIKASALVMEHSNITDCSGHLSGGVYLESSDLSLFKCNFTRNKFKLEASQEEGNAAGDLLYINRDADLINEVDLRSASFLLSDKLSLSLNSIAILSLGNCLLKNTNNQDPKATMQTDFVKGLYIKEAVVITVKSCEFVGLWANLGAAFHIITQKILGGTDFIIQGSAFRRCAAAFGGALFLQGHIHTTIEGTEFANNSALKIEGSLGGVGGAAIIDCEDQTTCSFLSKKTIFSGNFAELYAPTLFSKLPLLSENFISADFLDNWDGLGFTRTYSSYPIKAKYVGQNFEKADLLNKTFLQEYISSSDLLAVPNLTVVSGEARNITLLLLDEQRQILAFDNRSVASLKFVNSSQLEVETTFENAIALPASGIFRFENLKIIMNPNSRALFSFNIDFAENINFNKLTREKTAPLNLFTNVVSRPCVFGELLRDDLTCFRCPPGTYSFDDPMAVGKASQRCNQCITDCHCLGGNIVVPKMGSWRISPKSTTILQCYIKDICTSVFEYNVSYFNMSESFAGVACHSNHMGNLCFNCKPGFGKITSNSLCESCSDLGMLSYVKFAIVIVALFSYTLFYVNLYSKVIMLKSIEKRILLKILVNHLQQIGIIAMVDMGFSITIKDFFNIQSYLAFFTGDIFSIECILDRLGGELKVSKTIFSLVMPILLSFLFVVFWVAISVKNFILIRKFPKNIGCFRLTEFILKLRLYILVCFFMLYPQLIKTSLSLIDCILLDQENNVKALRDDPDILCWDDAHLSYVKLVALPGLLFWGIFIPILCGVLLKWNKKQIFINLEFYNNQVTTKLSENPDSSRWEEAAAQGTPNKDQDIFTFIYLGYSKNHYHWEVVMFVKKLLISLISVFTEFFPSKSKAIVLLVVLALFLYLNVRKQPYLTPFLNRFDTFSLVVSFVTASVGVLLFSEDLYVANPFFMMIIVLSNVGFFVLWIYYFFKKSYGIEFWPIVFRTIRSRPWNLVCAIREFLKNARISGDISPKKKPRGY